MDILSDVLSGVCNFGVNTIPKNYIDLNQFFVSYSNFIASIAQFNCNTW